MTRVEPTDANRRESGFVLVNTLVIVLALSVLALRLLQDVSQGTEHLSAMRTNDQAELISEAGVAFAADLLAKDARRNAFDHRGESWALSNYVADADEIAVSVSVSDLESRFNLNLLISDTPPVPLAVLQRLIDITGASDELAVAIEQIYTPFQPGVSGILTKKSDDFVVGDLTHPLQIAAIDGLADVNADDFRDSLSVLPRGRGVNVNTATPNVLAAVTVLDTDSIDAILALRKDSPFESVKNFTDAVAAVAGPEALLNIPTDLLSVSSAWFLVETSVIIEPFRHHAKTILFRDPVTGDVSVFARESERTG